ncbi:MAG: hypothetical protein Tsb007_01000 [Rhizobacter sp.]
MQAPVSPSPNPLQARALEILSTALDAIITIDAQQRIVLFNEAAVQMFRLSAQEALGQPLDRLIPTPHRAAHHAHVGRYARGEGPSHPMSSVRALKGLRSDGHEFPIEASVSRSGRGDNMLMTVLVRDVTAVRDSERKRLEQAAREAANLAKTEFLARMSHELRTPLNAVLGMAQLLQAGLHDRLSEPEQHQFELLQAGGQQLRTLIDHVLDLSRLEAGELVIESREIELCELIDSALVTNASLAQTQQVRLQSSYEVERPFTVHADPARLYQVVSHLVSNGIKLHRSGGVVRVEVKRERDCACISVIDDGAGLTAEQQALLFEPFNRLGRERSDIDGAGIGMALAHHLVTLMGGRLVVESSPGQGTALHVHLPVAQAQRQPSGTVLYIEDNAVNALLVVEVLRQWPEVRVVVAVDGASGLEQAHQLQPDVLLLDMQLPDMNGLQVLKRLKQEPATRKLKVVALSANAVGTDVDATLRAGAVAYWTKPIDFAPFLEKMRTMLLTGCGENS